MADLPTGNLMQPTLVSKPFHREGWIWEEKYDGWRMLAY
jgi:ATP-dependent DNA ligase